jgi:hypothetical protein
MTSLPNFHERLKSGATYSGWGNGNVGTKASSTTFSDPTKSTSTASFSGMGVDHSSRFGGEVNAFGWSRMPIDPSYSDSFAKFRGSDKVAIDATATGTGLPGIKALGSTNVDMAVGPGGHGSFEGGSTSSNWL